MKNGFTLIELLVAVTVSAILAGITGASYISIQKLIGNNEQALLLAENARVVIDRISRDFRQTDSLVTTLQPDVVNGVSAIEFEDGHQVDPAGPTYITYQFDSGTGEVSRHRQYYYDVDDPDIHLPFNQVIFDQGDLLVQEISSDTYTIAENVSSLNFYGDESLVKIDVILQTDDGSEVQSFHSAVARRN